MMRAYALEWRKLRGKHVLLTAALMIGAEILFVSMNLLAQYERLTTPGQALTWGYLLSPFGMFNGLFFPAMLAVCASRLADMEHEGGLRLAGLCGERLSRLWDCKMGVLLTIALCAVGLQTGVSLLLGKAIGLAQPPDIGMLLRFMAGTLMVSFPAAVIPLFIALWFENQLIALAQGMLAALIGFISSLLPSPLRNLLLYGNFAELITAVPQEVRPGHYEVMDTPIRMLPLALTLLAGVLLFALARRKIAGREC